jgi:integral membrane sensor domain MASE1
MRFLPKRGEFSGILITATSQVLLGYFTLFIQAIYPVWSSPFWPASGAALAAVMLGGPRMLLGVYLGLLVLGFKFFWGPYPLWMAFVVPCGNLAETTLAYFLLRYFVPKFDFGFSQIRQLAAFILFCPWIPALTSAVSIQLLLQAMGTVPPERFLSEVAVYSLGNATGILLLTPLILVWRDFRSFPWKDTEGRKIIGVLLLLFTGLWFYYANWAPVWGRLISVALIPAAVWGVWSTGIRGATLACLLGSISYFAFDVPGARPLSSLLEQKQKSAELRFAMEKQLTGAPAMQPPPRLARDISDQIGLLAVICITILPLGVASDELRKKAVRDRLVMATLSSSFWNWSPATGNQIENPQIAKLFSPSTQLFQPNRKTGSMKIRPVGPEAPSYLSHWLIQEADALGNPLQATGILQNYSMEEERDAALAQARLAELEIQTLRSHLNPHLLFNCLTGLRGLITQDAAKAREFSGNLARFLRAVVDSENQKTVPLRRELAICEDFIRLEELRGRPIDLQVELTSRDRDVSIPPLTLVTLLENAAKHGLRRNDGPLPVIISADRPDSNHLRLRVQQPGTLLRPTDHKNHAGLDLIRRQLEMVLGEESRLELLEQPPGSVVANLILPA